jgi:hypothetical protein
MSLFQRLAVAASLAAGALVQGCTALPEPILKPLPEQATSRDGKLTWRKTGLGYIIEGEYDGTIGRFEYLAHDPLQGPYIRSAMRVKHAENGKEATYDVVAYDGNAGHALDGFVNRVEINLGIIRPTFVCEDGKDPLPQHGQDAKRLKEVLDEANRKYHAFYEHLLSQFDPPLVRIAWEGTIPWKCAVNGLTGTGKTEGEATK